MATDQFAELAELSERLLYIRGEIAAAARAAGRRPEDVTLIGVSKFVPASLAGTAVDLGLADLGENRVQDLLAKIDDLAVSGRRPRWHMIGTLQKNKVKQIVGKVELIHSVDSLELLGEISRVSLSRGLSSRILLQVNTSGEESKHGFAPGDLAEAADRAAQMAGIRLCGLMTMAPLSDDPETVRPVFCKTFGLFRQIAGHLGNLPDYQVLSMGMSQDFRQAIACGATHVRIGTAIFGPRL